MAFPAITAALKGASGLFKIAKTAVSKFRAKRKEQKAQFFEGLKTDPKGTLQAFSDTGNLPSNPLGITTSPTGNSRILQTTGEEIQATSLGTKIMLKKNKNLPYIIGGAALVIGYFLLGKKGKRR